MYNLNDFCNVIAYLRKEKGWTQTMLADQLNISPQSVSKWECGIGYPDVTMFPVIAGLLEVPIGVLFGEKLNIEGDNRMNIQQTQSEYNREFALSKMVRVFLGNICRVKMIADQGETCRVKAVGDPVFLRYFDVEKEGDNLVVNIKNPCGSSIRWEEYDRLGYTGENFVQVFTGSAEGGTGILSMNYLNLCATSLEDEQGNYEVICSVDPSPLPIKKK